MQLVQLKHLIGNPLDLDSEKVALEALKIAADICVYTNHNITLEKIDYLKWNQVLVLEKLFQS